MQVHSHFLVAAIFAVTLLTACGERAGNEPAASTAPAATPSETAPSAEAPGTTTNFEDSSSSEAQTPAPAQ